ncbi:TonB-dependent receptor [Alteromonas pelagimontana]|uniref:TonB-dependent receptor n=1 Tax=Alteromonas pelagimontana TaxID=1858656 RepID=A0A6M4MF28_9ALTE|nr:TonB-dependent receptor [Alteromonas pelagimontana]QJR81699.1 TonB-dependent receptor [Alteromonas pelagimontana]
MKASNPSRIPASPQFKPTLCALLVSLAFTAEAQTSSENPVQADQETVEKINVVGSRLQTTKAIATKLSTDKFVDSISEDEAASFAGENAAETLTSLPAITIQGNGETITNRFVTIRGINPDWNLTTLNDLNVATPNASSRSQYFDLFPSNLAKRIEVFKTFTASDQGGSIGGVTNFVSRRGSEFDKPIFIATGGVGFAEIDESVEDRKLPFNIDLTYASKLTEKLGVSVSASYNQRARSQPSTLPRSRSTTIDGITIPREYRLAFETTDIERVNLSTTVDYLLDESTTLWLAAGFNKTEFTKYHYKSDERITSGTYSIDPIDENTGYVTVDESTEDGVYGGAHFAEIATINTDSDMGFIQAGYEKLIGDLGFLEVKGSYSKATESRLDRYSLFFHTPERATFFYDKSNPSLPTIGLVETDGQTLDTFYAPEKYHLQNDQYNPRETDADMIDLALNYSWNTGKVADGLGFKVGAKYTTSDRSYDYNKHEYRTTDAGAEQFTLATIYVDPPNVPYPGMNSNRRAMFGDLGLRNSLISSHVSDANLFTLMTSDSNDYSSDYTLDETISSAYAKAEYNSDDFFAHAGLRYEDTDYSGTGYRLENGDWIASSLSNDYAKLLPSAGINYHLTDDLRLSATYSKTIARPDYVDLAPLGEVLDLSETGVGSITRSNPDLKPRSSNNYDVYADWVITDGLISAGYFYKDIKDEIITLREMDELTIDGQVYDMTISQKVNSQSARLSGFELNVMKELTFLPAPWDNLGVNINGTLMSGDFKVPDSSSRQDPGFLLTQPEKLANVAVYYSGELFDARIIYSYTGEKPVGFDVANEANDLIRLSRTDLSAKVRYFVNDNLELYASGTNLTSEDFTDVRPDGALYRYRNEGRNYKVGITYKF